MVTQISGFNTFGVQKDPRRTSQRIQFKDNSMNYQPLYVSDEKDQYAESTIRKNVTIVLGTLLFAILCFMASQLKTLKK